jgi:diamine N-acetyltransferase
MEPTLDRQQFRSGPDPERDLTFNVNEWRGEIWGVCSGAGIQKGYVVGTRSGDELRLGVSVLQEDGTATGAKVNGRVVGADGTNGSGIVLDWDLGPARLERSGWTDPDTAPEELDERPGPTGQVRLVEIDDDNISDVLRLRVAPHQEEYVADNATSIAEGSVCVPRGWFRAVYDGDVCVGFVMLANFDDPAHKYYPLYHGWYLWRLMIAAQHQRRGYGTQVLGLVCGHIDEQGGPRRLSTSWSQEVGGPAPFYRSFGFEATGEIDDGEEVALLRRWPDGSPADS